MMTKDQLLKLAEHGVRVRLQEIQAELNQLAYDFPHIVNNQNGTTPAVLPLETKKKNAGHGGNRTGKPHADRLDEMRRTLHTHPGSTVDQLASMLHVHRSTAYAFVRVAGHQVKTKGQQAQWFLKGAAATTTAKKTKRAAPVPAKERLAALRLYLSKHPGATTAQLSTALGVSKNRLLALAHRVARLSVGGGRVPATWTLKNDARKTARPVKSATLAKAVKAARGRKAAPKKTKSRKLTAEQRAAIGARMKQAWANYTPEQRAIRGAKTHANDPKYAELAKAPLSASA